MNTLVTSIEAAEVMLGFSDLGTRDEARLVTPPYPAARSRLEWCRRAVHGKREEEIAGVLITRGKWDINVFGDSGEDRILPLPLWWLAAEVGDDRMVILLHKTEEVFVHMRGWGTSEVGQPGNAPDGWRIRVAASSDMAFARFGVLLRLSEE